MKATVSLITYNHAPYIAQAIESVLMQQTSFDFELLIGEDDSRDGTRQIVTDYQRRFPGRIRLLLNDRKNVVYVNGKPTGLWNLANNIRLSRGEYIALLEGDDCWTSPHKLQKQVEFLENNRDCALCFHNVRILDEADPARQELHYPKPGPDRYDLEDLLRGNFMHTCSVMYRSRLFDDFPSWFFKCPLGDWPLHVLNAQHGRIGYLDEVMGVYRKHAQGAWSAQTQVQILAGSIQTARWIRTGLTAAQRKHLDAGTAQWYRDSIEICRSTGDPKAAGRLAAAYLRRFPLHKDTDRLYLMKLAIRGVLSRHRPLSTPPRSLVSAETEGTPQSPLPVPVRPIPCAGSGPPVVSVLVPVFNGEPFLAECLESVLAQDFGDYELLLSDDGSTDGSASVIERYARRNGRIRWWRNPRNLGIGGNFNACLKAAQGRYIKYVLQDDKLIDPSVVRRMVAALESNPSVALVVSAAQLIDAQSRPGKVRDNFGRSGVWDGKQIIVRCLEQDANLIGEPSLALFRRCQAARGFDEGLKQLLDLEMWFHLLERGNFAYINEPLCAFRQHPAQQTEANRRSGHSVDEDLVLLERYCARPWMTSVMTPQARFTRLYYLRSRPGLKAAATRAELAKAMGSRSYAVCWLRHKLTRPYYNLRRSVRKRLGPHREAGSL